MYPCNEATVSNPNKFYSIYMHTGWIETPAGPVPQVGWHYEAMNVAIGPAAVRHDFAASV